MLLLTKPSCNGSSDRELTSVVVQKDVQNSGMCLCCWYLM